MAIFKAVVQKPRSDGSYLVYIRCTHNRKLAFIKTDKYVEAKKVKGSEIKDQNILIEIAVRIKKYRDKLLTQDTENWDVKDVVEFIQQGKTGISFFTFCDIFLQKLSKEGRDNSYRGYMATINSFRLFIERDSITFQEITSKLLKEWIESLKSKARAKEMYPTLLKAMFNAGCEYYNDYERDIIRITNQPFRSVKIPKADTPIKRAIESNLIRKIFRAEPTYDRGILAQDVIKMVFYLVGINTVDLYSQKKTIYKDGKICYNRAKTKGSREDKAYIEIAVNYRAKPFFEKYKDKKHLFNFANRYTNSNEFNRGVNKGLKGLCEELGIEKIDTYTFRHSWATIARNHCGASDAEVAFALNHVSAHKITQRYIKIDYSPIDKLNKKVMAYTFRVSIIEAMKDKIVKLKKKI